MCGVVWAILQASLQPSYLVATEPEDHIVRTRTYDMSISYDKYYQVRAAHSSPTSITNCPTDPS